MLDSTLTQGSEEIAPEDTVPARRRGRALNIVLKVTERCNLACTYCYFFFQGDQSWQKHTPVLKAPVIDRLCGWIGEACEDMGLDAVHIGLHGGEPLLMKKHAFDAMCTKLRASVPPGVRLTLGMQTNGVLIDPEWIEIFVRHDIFVGFSIDGPKAINDAARVDHKGRGSYDKVIAGLRLVQAAAREGRMPRPGALCVTDPSLDPAMIYDHLVGELDMAGINFLFPREGHDETVIDGPEWRRYMRDLITHWVRPETRTMRMRILSEPLQALISDDGAERQDVANAQDHAIVTISSDGDLGPDDNIKPLDPRFQDWGMTIFETSYQDFLASPEWQELVDANERVPEKCRSCDWQRSCGSGQLFNRYGRGRGFDNESVFCEAIDEIHLRLTEYAVSHGIPLEGIARRLAEPRRHEPRDFVDFVPEDGAGTRTHGSFVDRA